MASYQIPQFLDSGDKIFLMLNIRQFGYALFGFFLCTMVYVLFNQLIPSFGAYNSIFALPVVVFFAYLSAGKYNGRDTEVYIFKVVTFFFKPRRLIYSKNPDTEDLDKKLAELTNEKVQTRWSKEYQILHPSDAAGNFATADEKGKISKIKELGSMVDLPATTILGDIKRKMIEVERKGVLVKAARELQLATRKGIPLSQSLLNNPVLNEIDLDDPYDNYVSGENFFDVNKIENK